MPRKSPGAYHAGQVEADEYPQQLVEHTATSVNHMSGDGIHAVQKRRYRSFQKKHPTRAEATRNIFSPGSEKLPW
jgi:hypothetical protein